MASIETQQRHEQFYRITVEKTAENIAAGVFGSGVFRILGGLRTELAQCLELTLISPEFYHEQTAKISDILQQP